MQCHASTIEKLPDGRLAVAWFAGTKERNPDTAIWMSFFGGRWTKPSKVAKISGVAHWNPVLFMDPDGDVLHLFFRVGENVDSWRTYRMVSKAPFDSWSEADPIGLVNGSPEMGRGPVRSKIIVLSNGRWLAPSSHEKVTGWNVAFRMSGFVRYPRSVWDSFVDISDDGGKTWRMTEYVPFEREKGRENDGGVIQPTIWETSGGNVHMFLRSTNGLVYRSDSSDYGESWSRAEATPIPNPNSAIDVAKNKEGLLMLAYNHVSGNWVARTPLSISFSAGEGTEWSDPAHVEVDEYGSFSYPSVIADENRFLMSYTWNRQSIACLAIRTEAEIDNGRLVSIGAAVEKV